ncbi:MAG: UvrD-helicase domain-containing protein [Deltaproteobacteria bacterium]
MSLNHRQSEAVEYGDGPILVLAGAGSGKTRVLVHRAANLISSGRARADEILAMTFTNKAAAELVERTKRLSGAVAADLWVGTFHGIGARLLRRHGQVLGYPSRFSIYDRDDQTRLIKETVAEANLDPVSFHHDLVRAFIEKAKNEARLPEETTASGPQLPELYRRYQQRLQGLGAMDFGDLILNVIRLFRHDKTLLESYQRRFRYILVDEYQDTNRSQYLMVSMLAAAHGNICVVGDDDQSIYGWRGADIRNILEFERDFPGAHVVHLDQNYRSTSNIINAAAAVIANNDGRMDKKMWTDNAAGSPLRIVAVADERDEARLLSRRLGELGDRRGDAAIFYRTHAQSRPIEEELIRKQIPYIIVGGTRFYDRQEIRDLIAYLRFVSNPMDDLSLSRIANVPARGIGKVTWERLGVEANRRSTRLWTVLSDDSYLSGLASAVRSRLQGFRNMATPWLEHGGDQSMAVILDRIIRETDYVAYLERSAGEQAQSRIENVHELITVAQNFDRDFDSQELDEEIGMGALDTFLEQIALASDVDGYTEDTSVVTLMTVHNSKGLEFEHVFMVGMEEGIFPHARSREDGDGGIEEERRLFYVAMTRARQHLTAVYAKARHVYGTYQHNLPSRFIDEIPAEFTVFESSRAVRSPATTTPASYNRSRDDWTIDDTALHAANPDGQLRAGLRVAHPMFGIGTVCKVSGSGDNEKIVVRFQRVGLKKLVSRYARLELVV